MGILVLMLAGLFQSDPIEEATKKHDAALKEAQREFDDRKKKADEALAAVLRAQAKAAVAKGDVARAKKAMDKLEELQKSSGSDSAPEAKGLQPGLQVLEYALLEGQLKSGKPLEKQPCPLGSLVEPVSQPKVITSLEKWANSIERNAVARGFIKISAPGEYFFKTHNYYGHCQLLIGTKEVNKFREDGTPGSIRLNPGYHALLCVAWGNGNGEATQVQWMPPGTKEWVPIPEDLLFYQSLPK